MGYMEPPRLYQPVKHCLGYVLMQAGNPQRAAEVIGPIHAAHQNPCHLLRTTLLVKQCLR